MAAPRAALPSINDSWPNGLAATVFLHGLMDGTEDGRRRASAESLLIKQGAMGGGSEHPPPTVHGERSSGMGARVWKGKEDRAISL